MLKDYHHFKGNDLTRSEKIQRKVTELILASTLIDDQRENSKIWEFKHHAGTVQIGRILAQKRNLDPEIAEIICVLHDIYAVIHGKYKNHALLGAELAKKVLIDSHDFSNAEITRITDAIAHHSDKHINTNKPYDELAKDADVFECSLYEGAEGFYRLHKPEPIFKEYVKRIKKIREELGLPAQPIFR